MSVTRRTWASAALSAAFVVLVPALAAGAAPRADARGATRVHETPEPPAQPGENVVALTFDDGPHARYTPAVLDTLSRYGVRATFFALGREAEAHPDLVQRIVAEGHVIANHTWDHRDLRSLGEEQFAFQIDHTTQVLESISGQRVLCARPPGGKSDAGVQSRLAARGLTSVVWSADSRDFEKPGADVIAERAVADLQPGAIILLHDGGGNRDQTIAALPTIIERIHAAGYRIAPICHTTAQPAQTAQVVPGAPAPPPPPTHEPTGELTTAEGQEGGHVRAAGWAADPDAPDVPVDLHLDGTFATRVSASGDGASGPPWEAVLTAKPGPHDVCAYAIGVGPGAGLAKLGCATVEVPPLTPFDDLRMLAARLLFVQLQQERAALQRSALQRVALVQAARRAVSSIDGG